MLPLQITYESGVCCATLPLLHIDADSHADALPLPDISMLPLRHAICRAPRRCAAATPSPPLITPHYALLPPAIVYYYAIES